MSFSLAEQRISILASQAQALLKWRWLVLAVGVLVGIGIELIEGHRLTDHSFLLEVFVYGVVFPFLGWLLLTILAYSFQRRAKSEERLERHRNFSEQLAKLQEWDELTRFIVQFPGTLLPIVRASLYTYEHQQARFDFVTEWNSLGVITFGRPLLPEMCTGCLLHKSPRGHGIISCPMDAEDYCLPLIYNSVLVGAIQLKRRPGHTFPQDSINFVESVLSEIALALALLIAHPRQLAQAQAAAQLIERRRITYDLHDSLAQQVGYIHLALDRIASYDGVADNARLQTELEQIRNVANDAYERIRNILSLLRSQENIDLNRAIVDYANTVSRTARLQIEVSVAGELPPLPPMLSQNIFNLVREGLNNVEKHAQAERVQIDLIWSEGSLHLVLMDDGVGFDPAAAPADGHYGLIMMTERVKAVHGDLKIDSSPGRGTRLLFKIPFPRSQPHPDRSPQPARNNL